MGSFFRLFIRVNAREDNTTLSSITEFIKARHEHVIVEGIFDAAWRGFDEDTLVITVIDHEDVVAETMERIKEDFNTEYLTALDQGNATVM